MIRVINNENNPLLQAQIFICHSVEHVFVRTNQHRGFASSSWAQTCASMQMLCVLGSCRGQLKHRHVDIHVIPVRFLCAVASHHAVDRNNWTGEALAEKDVTEFLTGRGFTNTDAT